MKKVIVQRWRCDERVVKEKYLKSIDDGKYHWTANIDKALRINYETPIEVCDVEELEEMLYVEYFKTYKFTCQIIQD